jgi:hypothetical protein
VAITQFASQRIVQNTAATLSAQFVDQDGEPRTPGTSTVHITLSDGSDLIAAGASATVVDDLVTFALTPAQSATLDILTCTWTETSTGATTQTVVEIVGGHCFTIAYARGADPALRDVIKFPDDDIKRVRDEVEQECYRITGRSFFPRYRLDQNDAGSVRTSSAKPLQLTEVDIRNIRWVKINGVTYASTYWELTSSGQLFFGRGIGLLPEQVGNGPWRGNLPVIITAGYEYGWPSCPEDLRKAMRDRLRSRLTDPNSGIPDRATTMTMDGVTYSMSTPGIRGAKTGIPSVDEVYRGYTRKDWTEDYVGTVRIV